MFSAIQQYTFNCGEYSVSGFPALIRKTINHPEEPFYVWGSGSQGRAFIHVDDIVNALCLALEYGWGHGHIQIGPSVCTSIKEIAEIIGITEPNVRVKVHRIKEILREKMNGGNYEH